MPGFGGVASQGGGASGFGGLSGGDLFGLAQMFGGLLGGGQQQQVAPANIPGVPAGTGPILGDMSQLAARGNFGAGTLSEAITPPESEKTTPPKTFPERATEFVNNVDRTLSSPTKTIGLGLLGEIDPRLVYAGLLAAGLFDKKGGA